MKNRYYVLFGLALWCFSIYLRSTIVDNIKPWELEWVFWVISTSITSAFMGWGFKGLYEARKLRVSRNGAYTTPSD